jgi:hypothetical protein
MLLNLLDNLNGLPDWHAVNSARHGKDKYTRCNLPLPMLAVRQQLPEGEGGD